MKMKNGFKVGDFIRRKKGKVVYEILSFGTYRGGDTIVRQIETDKRYEIQFNILHFLLVDSSGKELVGYSELFPIY